MKQLVCIFKILHYLCDNYLFKWLKIYLARQLEGKS